MNKIDKSKNAADQEKNSDSSETGQITDTAKTSLEDSLSQTQNMTPEEKMDMLINNMGKLSHGLDQMIEMLKIMLKSQMDSSTAMTASFQKNFQKFADQQSEDAKQLNKKIESLVEAQAKEKKAKEVFKELYEFKHGNWYISFDAWKCLDAVLASGNINVIVPDGRSLLQLAVEKDNLSLVRILLEHPDIYVDDWLVFLTNNAYIKDIIRKYLQEH